MKNFLKKLVVFVGIIAATSVHLNVFQTSPVFADTRIDGTECSYILGMVNWDCNFDTTIDSEDKLISNIVTIASNILTDISVIASYLVIGYVIYGGYLYMFSSGDTGKVAAGKKTLTHAFIGLAICISAYTIFGAIRVALLNNTSINSCDVTTAKACITPDEVVTNLITWVVGVGGVVAAAFVVIGGWGYVTSAGDPNKLQKAKNTILYAIIGLVIVGLVEIITAFVASTIRNANDNKTSLAPPTTMIAKTINKENL